MIYVMSDVHGMYDKFIEMMEKIDLQRGDHLYILGDVFDRGPDAIKILDYIIPKNNITLLKGNHEKMFEEYYEGESAQLWYMNGGIVTHNEILSRGQFYEDSLYKYIKTLDYFKVVGNYILSHAEIYIPDRSEDITIEELAVMQDEETCIWSRSSVGRERKFQDYTIVLGHTPVKCIDEKQEDILKKDGTIYIDCGACFSDGKLACLRLDDLKEYYV